MVFLFHQISLWKSRMKSINLDHTLVTFFSSYLSSNRLLDLFSYCFYYSNLSYPLSLGAYVYLEVGEETDYFIEIFQNIPLPQLWSSSSELHWI